MKLLQPVTFSFLAMLVAGISLVDGNSVSVSAQEADSTEIYLDEPGKEPPPTVVRQDTQKANYDDENPRMERGVAYLSNDQVVSHGKYVEFYRSGKKYSEGTYDMDLHTGQWKYWHPNEQICKSVNFKAGKPHGQWDVFRPDGSREASKGYENGMRHGPWVIYFEGSKQPKVELTYNQGKIDGERLIYYANGQLRQQILFENGLMHGKVTNWDEEGKKVSEMQFEEGKIVGKPKQF